MDQGRALLYRLLGQFLAQPPSHDLLLLAAGLEGEGAVGAALADLAAQAGVSQAAARAEYDALFIGVSRGELVPYASYYLTGFLHERPLARLRADMDRLGYARTPDRSDPEDHVASICEVMASLIEDGAAASRQQEFFGRHLLPWADRFFADLEQAASARLYRPIAALGRLLIQLELQGFELADTSVPQRGAA